MSHLIEEIVVSNTLLKVKFLKSVRASSLTNEHFTLYTGSATPVETPFRTISLETDYNSIGRTLILYFQSSLLPLTDYTFTVTGLLDASGAIIADETATFTTLASTTPTAADVMPPEPDVLDIEDHSIKSGAFTSSETIFAANPLFFIDSTDPSSVEPIIESDYKDGRITIKFNTYPATNYLLPELGNEFFVAQRKKIQRGLSRWETIATKISVDQVYPWVYVDFPSLDATPAYHTAGSDYFESGYKYRVRISKNVAV